MVNYMGATGGKYAFCITSGLKQRLILSDEPTTVARRCSICGYIREGLIDDRPKHICVACLQAEPDVFEC